MAVGVFADEFVRGGEAFRTSAPPLEVWEAEDCGGLTGTIVKDSEASGGLARFCSVADAASEYAFYGQYRDLPPGKYAAVFRIKIDKSDSVPELRAFSIMATANRGEIKYGDSSFLIKDCGEDYMLYPVPFEVLEKHKEIEAVVRWDQNCDIRIDKADIYAWEGPLPEKPGSDVPMLEEIVPGPDPKDLEYTAPEFPGEDIFPVSKPVARHLYVTDISGLPYDIKLMLAGLQGLVNRDRPQLFLCAKDDEAENRWLDWMKERGDIDSVSRITPEAAVKKFKKYYRGAVITDRRIPATINAATMYASVNDCLICTERLAERYGLPVRLDMRGMFENNAQPYYWAYATLWDKLYHHTASCLNWNVFNIRDYLVQHKIFVFWIPGRIDGATAVSAPKEEMAFVNLLLSSLPANTPIMGYPWAGTDIGIGEHAGVGLFAEYGHFLVGSAGGNNYSVHSGARPGVFRQREPRKLTLDRAKRYVAFSMSDGDNLPVISSDNWPRRWHRKERGSVPITWTISPASCILLPDIMDYYYSTATENDTFGAAVSGVGYTYPALYGKRYKDRAPVFGGFLELTDRYMKKMDLRVLFPMHVTEKEIWEIAEGLPWLGGQFPDYFRNVTRYSDSVFLTAGGMPVLRSSTTWDTSDTRREYAAQHMAKEITSFPAVKEGEPAFIHAFLCNWGYDSAIVERIAELLPEEYVFVSAEEIAALEKEYLQSERLLLSVPGEDICMGGEDAALSFTAKNTAGEALEAAFTLAGADSEPLKVMLEPGKREALEMRFAPMNGLVYLEAAFDGKTKKQGVLLRTYDLKGTGEDIRDYKLAAHHPADALPSINADVYTDAEGNRYRKAVSGETRDGAVIYGPYEPLEPGRYVAVFNIMRLDEKGDGEDVCEADVVAAGSEADTAGRDISRKELPAGEPVNIYLPFEWTGGQAEYRIHWKSGSDSIRVDGVSILKKKR
ncbi:MAG: hypothetical protein ILO36_08705 [Abditibacteriota bacterium]|nr:hypothetical protein [Abditibacteriota bacterium]